MAAANGGWNPAWLRFAAVKGRRVDVVKVCPALEVDLFEHVKNVSMVREFLNARDGAHGAVSGTGQTGQSDMRAAVTQNKSRSGTDFS